MPLRNPHSVSLSQHQSVVLRRAIVGGKFAKVSKFRKSSFPNLEYTLKIMLERGLIMIINGEDIKPTPRGRAVYQIAKERAQQFRRF